MLTRGRHDDAARKKNGTRIEPLRDFVSIFALSRVSVANVADRTGRRRDRARVGAQIPNRIGSSHAIRIARGRREPGIAETRPRGAAHLRE